MILFGLNRFYPFFFRFSIAINNEFAGDFWNSFKTRIVYKFLPTLLTSTKILHRSNHCVEECVEDLVEDCDVDFDKDCNRFNNNWPLSNPDFIS